MFKTFVKSILPVRFLAPLRTLATKPVKMLDADQFGWHNSERCELLPGFPIGPDDTVVDVGCGMGLTVNFASRCGAEVYALDIDPAAIKAVQDRALVNRPARPVHAMVSDANPLPLPDHLATQVICQEVMEHVPDPRQFIAELVRVGRPGARYLLTVPDPVSESLQKKLVPSVYWASPNHVRVFEREEFARLVVDAGLRIERRTQYSFYWSMWWAFFWAGEGCEFGAGGTPVLEAWNKTWEIVVKTPKLAHVKKALDELMPKSQIIIARKPG